MRKTVIIDFDCTGFEKISPVRSKRERGYDSAIVNAQHFANVALFKLAIAKGEHPLEVAKSLGYTIATLRNWCRFFDGPKPTTK